MKFVFKIVLISLILLFGNTILFSKNNVTILVSENVSQKVFKIYFRDINIDRKESNRIKKAYLEKMYINSCTFTTEDSFTVATIKTDDLIDKKIILTILKRLGYSIDKEGKVSLIQE